MSEQLMIERLEQKLERRDGLLDEAFEAGIRSSRDDGWARRFLGPKARAAVQALKRVSARLQYAYLVVLVALGAHLMRHVPRVRAFLQAVNHFSHRRLGLLVVPLALLDFVIHSKGRLGSLKLRLEARHLCLRVEHNLRDSEYLFYELGRAAAALPPEFASPTRRSFYEPRNPGCQVDGALDVEGHAGGSLHG